MVSLLMSTGILKGHKSVNTELRINWIYRLKFYPILHQGYLNIITVRALQT